MSGLVATLWLGLGSGKNMWHDPYSSLQWVKWERPHITKQDLEHSYTVNLKPNHDA